MSTGTQAGVYLEGSHTFIAVEVTRNNEPWTDQVQLALAPRNTEVDSLTWFAPDTLDGQIGFYSDHTGLTAGVWDVIAKVTDSPEVPIFFVGYFVIR